DMNNDFIFDNETEKIIDTSSSGYSGSHTGTITIPELPLGDYRVRIGSSWSGVIDPCGSANGEYEDYTLTIVPPPSCLPPTELATENVTSDSVDLNWIAEGNLFDIEIVEAGEEPTGTPTETGVSNP